MQSYVNSFMVVQLFLEFVLLKLFRNVVILIFLGILLVIVVVMIKEKFDCCVWLLEDLVNIFGVFVLGVLLKFNVKCYVLGCLVVLGVVFVLIVVNKFMVF